MAAELHQLDGQITEALQQPATGACIGDPAEAGVLEDRPPREHVALPAAEDQQVIAAEVAAPKPLADSVEQDRANVRTGIARWRHERGLQLVIFGVIHNRSIERDVLESLETAEHQPGP